MTCNDTSSSTGNSASYDHIYNGNWSLSDYNQTYVVFRTNANDTDSDLKIDYDDTDNIGCWITVDVEVNLKLNEDSTADIDPDLFLEQNSLDS